MAIRQPNITAMVRLRKVKPKNHPNITKPAQKSPSIVQNSARLIQSNGRQVLNNTANMLNAVIKTATVEVCCSLSPNTGPRHTVSNTPRATALPPGSAFCMTLYINLPEIRSLLGSSASINDGIPTHRALISVSCIGWNG